MLPYDEYRTIALNDFCINKPSKHSSHCIQNKIINIYGSESAKLPENKLY